MTGSDELELLAERIDALTDESIAIVAQFDRVKLGSPEFHDLHRRHQAVAKEIIQVYSRWLMLTEPEPPRSAWN